MSLMKRIMMVAAGFMVAVAGSVSAQEAQLEVTVPFAFVVNGQTLPAGHYQVERGGQDPSVLLIRGDRGVKKAAYVMTISASRDDPAGDAAALVFTRYEAGYRLAAIWDGSGIGRELPGSGLKSARVADLVIVRPGVS